MQILYDNKIIGAILSRSSENPGYPIANVQDTKILKAFRTLSASGEWIKITSPAITASRFAILGHNLSSAAEIHLQGNDTDVWTAPSFDETITWKAGIILHSFTEATYNFWRLLITDSGRTYLSIGELYIGTYVQYPDITPDIEISDVTLARAEESSSGQVFGDDVYDYREWALNLLLTDEDRAIVRAHWAISKNNRPFIAVLWANDEDIELPIYCRMNQDKIVWKKIAQTGAKWSTTIEYKEVF